VTTGISPVIFSSTSFNPHLGQCGLVLHHLRVHGAGVLTACSAMVFVEFLQPITQLRRRDDQRKQPGRVHFVVFMIPLVVGLGQ